MLRLINTELKTFEELMEVDGSRDGVKWDDIILRMEWMESFKGIQEKYRGDNEVAEILEKASWQLKYSFNE